MLKQNCKPPAYPPRGAPATHAQGVAQEYLTFGSAEGGITDIRQLDGLLRVRACNTHPRTLHTLLCCFSLFMLFLYARRVSLCGALHLPARAVAVHR